MKLPTRQTPRELANELLKLDFFQARAERAIRSITEWARWKRDQPGPTSELRREERIKDRIANPRLYGSEKPYVVINSQGRSVYATDQLDLAEGMADNRYGRQVLDLTGLDPERRQIVVNALRANMGRTKAIIPPIPPRPVPKPPKEVDPEAKMEALLTDVRHEVEELKLPDAKSVGLLKAASYLAREGGWRIASDFIFEYKLTLYTNVVDIKTQEVIAQFEFADDAAVYCTELNNSEDGVNRNAAGKILGLRYKVARP